MGKTKAGKGVKIMAIVDRCGLPLSLSTHPANPHESTLVQLSLDLAFAEDEPAHLIGDKAYDSDPLDAALRERGVEIIAPHRRNRHRPRTQDGRRLRRAKRRWIVERFFGWMQMEAPSCGPLGASPGELPGVRPAVRDLHVVQAPRF